MLIKSKIVDQAMEEDVKNKRVKMKEAEYRSRESEHPDEMLEQELKMIE